MKQALEDTLTDELAQKFKETAVVLHGMSKRLEKIAGYYDALKSGEFFKESFLAAQLGTIGDSLRNFHLIAQVAITQAKGLSTEEQYNQIREAVRTLEMSEETIKKADQLIVEHKTSQAVEVLETEKGVA